MQLPLVFLKILKFLEATKVQEFIGQLKESFFSLGQATCNALHANEEAVLSLNAEDSTYIRFNNAKIRQNTSVKQVFVTLEYQQSGRSLKYTYPITGDLSSDQSKALEYLQQARQEAHTLPEDPFWVPLLTGPSSDKDFIGQLPKTENLIPEVLESVRDLDFTGIYASGPVIQASMHSKGQKHWFSTETFFLDYSLYTNNQKAVKGMYAGNQWNIATFRNKISSHQGALKQLEQQKSKAIPRGTYRVYLAPDAVAEIASTLSWGGLSTASLKRATSPLQKLHIGEMKLSSLFTLSENFNLGFVPPFNSRGELAPDKLNLIENGLSKSLLTNSRTAKEYGLPSNAANEGEAPRSLEIKPGKLLAANALKELGTGLYLSNLHYLNWSDQMNARITGMTRYACFWVEDGELKSPIEDLRFDISLYEALGDNLMAISQEQELIPSTLTYGARSLGGCKVPGLLIDKFNFTL